MRVSAAQALARARASLGRAPQDELEAAIVLESWGGLHGSHALELGRRASRLTGEGRRQEREPAPPQRLTGPASVLLVLAALAWAGLVASGSAEVGADRMVVFAGLPLGLGLAGFVERSFLRGGEEVAGLRDRAGALATTVMVPCSLVACFVPDGVLAAGLAVLLVSTTICARREAAVFAAAALLAAPIATWAGLPPAHAAAGSFVVVVAVVVAVVLRDDGPEGHREHATGAALLRGVTGVAVGFLAALLVLAADHGSGWSRATLLVVPAAVGGELAAARLDRVWDVVRRQMAAQGVAPRPDTGLARAVGEVIGGAALLGTATVTALSVVMLVVVAGPSETRAVVGILVSLAALATLGFNASLLQGLGAEVLVAAGAVLAATVALVVVGAGGAGPAGVQAGIVAATVLWFPWLLQLLGDTERVLAARR